jgi:hypothetical protein
MQSLFRAGLMLAVAAPLAAQADLPSDSIPNFRPDSSPDSRAELDALRAEIEAMRVAYEARMQALEQRLHAAEAAAAMPVPSAVSTAVVPATAAVSSVPAPVPTVASSAGGASAFNPAISLILSGLYTRTSRDPANYSIRGFQLPAGAEAGPGTRGFSLAESELGFAASIDPWLRGAASIAMHRDDTVSVEEAYIQTTSLGNGLALKAGRFFSGVGYLNPQHAHTWDFVDNPLAYQALLGTQYGDDGVQLTWLAPTDHYLELGVELGRGRSFPGSDTSRNGAGMAALAAHSGGDIGSSQSWRAGLSLLRAKASDLALSTAGAAGDTLTSRFTGTTRVWVADAVWKWAPEGNATRISLKLQAEYLRSTRNGSLAVDGANSDGGGDYRAVQSGWYLQGVYQFMPRWRVGLRSERLGADTPHYGFDAAMFADGGARPRKQSLMVDFNPSEFSRIRLQVARDQSREGPADNQFFLQYQMSLGAHGAHGY